MVSTASPKRPEGDIGAFRSTFRSASFRSAKFSQRCLWRTTIKPMALPHRLGRSLRRHQREVRCSAQILRRLRSEDSAPPPFAGVWPGTPAALPWRATLMPPSPSEAYALLARWAVVLHGFDGRLMSGPRDFRCCRAQVCSNGLLDGGRAHVTVGLRSIHVGEHGLRVRVDARRLGRRPRLHELFMNIGEKRHRCPCVSFAVWTWSTTSRAYSWQAPPEDSRWAPTPEQLSTEPSWAPPGGLKALSCLAARAPIQPNRPSPRPRWTWPRRPPRGQKLRIPQYWKGGRKQSSGKRWANAATVGFDARQDGAPAARRGGAHQRHAGGSEPDPEQAANHIAAGPEHADREVRAKSTVGLVQRRPRREPGPGRRRNGDADPAVRWVPRRSYTLKPSRVQGEVKDSDIIVASIAFILSRARRICMLCDNWPVIWLAWANRTSGKVEGKKFP